MAAVKSYTDLEQSRKLAEILPLETADMCYQHFVPDLLPEGYCVSVDKVEYETDIPCWSLTALLNVLPTLDDRNAVLCKDIRYDKWHIFYHSTATLSIIDTERYDNPIDACVEMVIKLNELNLL